MPVVLAHKWIFGFSLVASFLGLVVQVQIPNEVGQAIDALGKTTGPSLEHFVVIIVVLAVHPLRAHVHVAATTCSRPRTASSTTCGTSCTST